MCTEGVSDASKRAVRLLNVIGSLTESFIHRSQPLSVVANGFCDVVRREYFPDALGVQVLINTGELLKMAGSRPDVSPGQVDIALYSDSVALVPPGALVPYGTSELPEAEAASKLRPRIGICGRAVRRRQIQRVADVTQDSDYIDTLKKGTRSELAVPVILSIPQPTEKPKTTHLPQDMCLAVLNIESNKLNHFTDDDEFVAFHLAKHLGAILRFADLDNYSKYIREAIDQLQTAIRFMHDGESNIETRFRDAIETMLLPGRAWIEPNHLEVILLNEDQTLAEIVYSTNPPNHKPTIGRILDLKEAEYFISYLVDDPKQPFVYYPDFTKERPARFQQLLDIDPILGDQRGAADTGTKCELAVPIRLGSDKLVGIINVESGLPYHFTPFAIFVLQRIASSLGIFLQMVVSSERMIRKTREAESIRALAYRNIATSAQAHHIKNVVSPIQVHVAQLRDQIDRHLRRRGAHSPDEQQQLLAELFFDPYIENIQDPEVRQFLADPRRRLTVCLNQCSLLIQGFEEIREAFSRRVLRPYQCVTTAVGILGMARKMPSDITIEEVLVIDETVIKSTAEFESIGVPVVLYEVLANAVREVKKLKGKQKEVRVSSRIVETASTEPSIVLEVRNTGACLTEQQLRTIFDPPSAEKLAQGSGFALFAARLLMQSQRGAIDGRNLEDGSGVIFEVRVPRKKLS